MYRFYFDESFHDRKIIIKENTINTFSENDIDSYVGFFWGASNSVADRVIKDFEELEGEYKKILGIEGELKATNFGKKNYDCGIRSFNRECFGFYSELFSVLDRPGVVFQYDVVSKIEQLLLQIFDFSFPENREVIMKYGIHPRYFIYSLAKFFCTYKNEELISALYNVEVAGDSQAFKICLIHQLRTICKAITGIERKELELASYRQMIFILANLKVHVKGTKKVGFSYAPDFVGLTRLLKELHINPKSVALTIDEEAKTIETAKKYSFGSVTGASSANCSAVRISDHLSNFVGRFIYAFQNDKGMKEDPVADISQIEENDLATKRLLSDEWFELSKEQFELYCKIAKVLIIDHQQYWTALTGIYFDSVISFAELFKFFYYIGDYNTFCQSDKKMMKEYLNSQICMTMQERHKMKGAMS